MSDSETHKGDKREELGLSLHGEKKVFPTRESTCL